MNNITLIIIRQVVNGRAEQAERVLAKANTNQSEIKGAGRGKRLQLPLKRNREGREMRRAEADLLESEA